MQLECLEIKRDIASSSYNNVIVEGKHELKVGESAWELYLSSPDEWMAHTSLSYERYHKLWVSRAHGRKVTLLLGKGEGVYYTIEKWMSRNGSCSMAVSLIVHNLQVWFSVVKIGSTTLFIRIEHNFIPSILFAKEVFCSPIWLVIRSYSSVSFLGASLLILPMHLTWFTITIQNLTLIYCIYLQ